MLRKWNQIDIWDTSMFVLNDNTYLEYCPLELNHPTLIQYKFGDDILYLSL